MISVTSSLPPALSLGFLCRLVGLDSRWSITTELADLPFDRCSALTDVRGYSATILISNQFHYSGKALARAVTHELLELAMYPMWSVFMSTVSNIADPIMRQTYENNMRSARDSYIDSRLNNMPFWTEFDLPIPKRIYADHD
jgi:hypothetical protein